MPNELQKTDLDRFTEQDGYKIFHGNKQEFEALWDEIMVRGESEIELSSVQPLIIEVGANIGISTLYFRRKYPNSKIIAIEPSPTSAVRFRKNVEANNLTDIEFIEAAVGNEETELDLYVDTYEEDPWSWGDSVVPAIWGGEPTPIKVKSVKLSEIIKRQEGEIDLLQIDIEGSELVVLKECRDYLPKVKNILLEYHCTPTNPTNSFGETMAILKKAGFEIGFYEGRIELGESAVNALQKKKKWNVIVKGIH